MNLFIYIFFFFSNLILLKYFYKSNISIFCYGHLSLFRLRAGSIFYFIFCGFFGDANAIKNLLYIGIERLQMEN